MSLYRQDKARITDGMMVENSVCAPKRETKVSIEWEVR